MKNVRGLTGLNVDDGDNGGALGINFLVRRRYFRMGPV